ncbi:ankyrin repeat domain-containing protein 26-like isoform X2 [Anopheles aquasalis]|uniref:ankyrin repeat domain-containing protein 26-like isoform X2 n=1 Tax=Anopheles aquasalis TaxID=42839 RepID=UPI00215AFBED|nr:ankyrin repeat domain-containing protein 26-like isoform X2 [Anopheles aquasalis]
MFNFFKRSKSQKVKQKQEPKLQPVAPAAAAAAAAATATTTSPVCAEERINDSTSAAVGVGETLLGAKVASVAYAGARGTVGDRRDSNQPPSHDGDEEKRPKNSFPPQPPAAPLVPPVGGGTEAVQPVVVEPVPSKCSPAVRPPLGRPTYASTGTVVATGPSLARSSDTITIGDAVSPSVSTLPNGPYRTDRHPSDNRQPAITEPINNDDQDDHDETIPIDDSSSSSSSTTEQQEADSRNASSYRYTPQNEGAMAKGKNRRRNYQQQQQQQQHQVKVNQQQQNGGLKASLVEVAKRGDSSGQLLPKALPTIDGGVDAQVIKVKEVVVLTAESAVTVNGDHVINGDVDKRQQTRPTVIVGDGSVVISHQHDPVRPLAKTRTGECADAPKAASNELTQTSHSPVNVVREELLNIKNISPNGNDHQHQQQQSTLLIVVKDDDDDGGDGTLPGRQSSDPVVSTSSSEPVAPSATAAPAAAPAPGTEVLSITDEMGQQPSRTVAGSEQQRSAVRSSKSKSPQPAPLPPPRGQRTNGSGTHQAGTATEIDGPGDDTSDDRDVFYEATETLVPVSTVPAIASNIAGVNGGELVARAAGTSPEPIRASLVLKIAEAEPLGAAERKQKRQVSFRLTQNGSDDVEVTNVMIDSDDDSGESGVSDGEQTEANGGGDDDNSDATVRRTPDARGGTPNRNAFSEKRDSFIEFQYDRSSAGDGGVPEKDGKKADNGVVPVESMMPLSPATTVIEDSVNASLPDVVRPTSIEPPFGTVEKLNSEMKDLVNQESRYSAKLGESEKRANDANAKVYELQQKLDAVERDASLKEYNVERLRAELDATLKECDGIRARLRTQESEMEAIRLRASEREDELNLKFQNLEIEHLELTEKLKEVRQLAHDLNSQLIDARSELDRLKEEHQRLLDARAEEQKVMRDALEESVQQRAQVEAKWKHDFEQLRNVNNDREEHLMQDCEFAIRNMQKTCKERIESVEKEKKQALDKVSRLEEVTRKQIDEVQHLKSYEAEVEQLRGLTYDQKEALATMTRQVELLKTDLQTATDKLEQEIVKMQQIKSRCEYQLCEKEREALSRIEIARGEIAMQWEDRLLREMNRLKEELEQMHMEERNSAIEKIQRESLAETEAMSKRFNERIKELKDEIESLKAKIEQQKAAMANAQSEADQKLLKSRMYVERAEREHEQKLAKLSSEKDEIIETLKRQFVKEKQDLEQYFTNRIQEVQEEFAREISDATEMMKCTHKKELETQWKTLIAEKEEALQLMESRNRNRLEDAENKVSFEEMRLRYERRESRPEDLQQIEELKSVVESQDRDLRLLTERLRELQLQQVVPEPQRQPQPTPTPRRSKHNKGKQNKQQQQNQQNQQQAKQQKKGPASPLAEVEAPLQEEPLEDDIVTVPPLGEQYMEESAEEPQIILMPPAQTQMMAPMMRTMCDVIYEENEADILREEEEAQRSLEQHQEAPLADDTEMLHEENVDSFTEAMQDNTPQEQEGLVVDVPESAIHTEVRTVHSTAPTIIEETESGDSVPCCQVEEAEPLQQSTIVIPIVEDVPPMPRSSTSRESSAPRIIVTDETGPQQITATTVVEISEEDPSVATVIELPAVYAKPYPAPAELSPESVGDTAQLNPSVPEMIVVRVPEGGSAEQGARGDL